MADIVISPIPGDSVRIKLSGNRSAIEDIADALCFEVPGANHHPKVRSGQWDGIIRLVNRRTSTTYYGLLNTIVTEGDVRGYEVAVDDQLKRGDEWTLSRVNQAVAELALPFQPHDYQIDMVVECLNARRRLVISPTSSGKSLIIYLLARLINKPMLIIVPTTALVRQMAKDFAAYGYTGSVDQILQGVDPSDDTPLVTVSTWQSMYKRSVDVFDRFDVIIGDEAHLFTANSLKELMEKTTNANYKIGMTGSLSGSKTHEMMLIALFGPKTETITTREMIDRGIASEISIKVFALSYPQEVIRKHFPTKRREYKDEVDFIIAYGPRNNFIRNLVASCKGNVIVLYRRVEDHGDILVDLLQGCGKQVYYINGKTKTKDRVAIQQIAEERDDVCIVASDKTFATGISINNIQNAIRVNPLKAAIPNIQGIGRGLRLDGKDNHCTYFDLGDVLTNSSDRAQSHLYRHMVERLELYAKTQLNFKVFELELP